MGDKWLTWRKVCLGRATGWRKLCKLTVKYASSKAISEESTDTSCALRTGCFLDTIYWIALQINTFYEISVYTKLNVCENLDFIIQAFSSHQTIKFLYTIKIYCAFNIDKRKLKADSIAPANAIPWYHGHHRLLSPDEPF